MKTLPPVPAHLFVVAVFAGGLIRGRIPVGGFEDVGEEVGQKFGKFLPQPVGGIPDIVRGKEVFFFPLFIELDIGRRDPFPQGLAFPLVEPVFDEEISVERKLKIG